MSKPVFLLCPGTPRSSTSLLSEALFQNKIFHYGYSKECSYLDFVYYKDHNPPEAYIEYSEHQNLLETLSKQHYFPQRKFDYQYSDFNEFSKNYTIENYYKYYLDVYTQTKFVGGVCDFSQSYNLLPENFLLEVKCELEKTFEVKCLLIFRDPIKRAYSFANMLRPQSARKFFIENVIQNSFQFSGTYYENIIKKFQNIFTPENIFISSMEELYLQDNFCKFNKFLLPDGPELDKISRSKYGTFSNSRIYEEKLSVNEIDFAKKKLYENYQYWKTEFGSLPIKWHQVI